MNPREISTSFLIATGHIRPMRGGAQPQRPQAGTTYVRSESRSNFSGEPAFLTESGGSATKLIAR